MEYLRVLRPAPDVYAFYDGRVDGYRFDPRPNWVDDGALSLGIASYAIVSGSAALVYDTHVSLEHAKRIRALPAEEPKPSQRLSATLRASAINPPGPPRAARPAAVRDSPKSADCSGWGPVASWDQGPITRHGVS